MDIKVYKSKNLINKTSFRGFYNQHSLDKKDAILKINNLSKFKVGIKFMNMPLLTHYSNQPDYGFFIDDTLTALNVQNSILCTLNLKFDTYKTNKKIIFKYLCLSGMENNVINLIYKSKINHVAPILIKANVKDTELNIYGNYKVIGNLNINKSYEIYEDSFILMSGLVINFSILDKLFDNKEVDFLLTIQKSLINESKLLFNDLSMDTPFNNFVEALLDHLEIGLIILAQNSIETKLNNIDYIKENEQLKEELYDVKKSHFDMVTYLEEQDYKSKKNNEKNIIHFVKNNLKDLQEFKNIFDDFNSYQYDLVKMMEKPIFSDLMDPQIKKFNLICKQINRNELPEMTLTIFENEWESLLSYASRINTSNFSSTEIQRIKDSKVMLSKALNSESTDNEKRLSIRALTSNLNGILPIDETTINWLTQATGLKEIEM